MGEVSGSRRLEALGAHFASLCLVALASLLLYTAARPIYTDDVWWHLGLGRAHLAEGPRLAADPLLFSAEAPPAPAAWLFDVGLYAVLELGGFGALRSFHVVCILAALLLAWRNLRGAGASTPVAALGTGVFLTLAAYRLFQLRPELATIAATLALYAVLLASPRAPGARRIALATALCAVWANLHAGFVLGPILLTAATLSCAMSLPLQHPARRAALATRTQYLALATGLATLATLANPDGIGAHLAYLSAGDATPQLSVVGDEWRPLALLAAPRRGTPPNVLVWALLWILIAAAGFASAAALRSWSRETEARWIDPAWVALAIAGLVAVLVAVRFTWLAFFAVLLVTRWVQPHLEGGGPALAAAAMAALLLPGYVWLGDWSQLSRGVPRTLARYAEPYAAPKYAADAAAFLASSGVEGRLLTRYSQGGFHGFWLAPGVRTFVNGSLNFPRAVMDDYLAIQTGSVASRRELLALLDRHDVDLFLGFGLPTLDAAVRPQRYMTARLEGAPGWKLVHRGLNQALYLRDEGRSDALERIAAHYAEQGVPFDPARGLDVARVLDAAPDWAIRKGLVPVNFEQLRSAGSRPAARNQLANLYATLGLYERALAIDRALRQRGVSFPETDRRRVFCLLHLDRLDEAQAAARALGRDPVSAALAAAARRFATLEDPERRALERAFLPLFTRAEAQRVARGRNAGRTPDAARP